MAFFTPNIEKLERERDYDGLIRALSNTKHERGSNKWIGEYAAEALCRLANPQIVNSLLAILNDSNKPHVDRMHAAIALGFPGNIKAIDALLSYGEYDPRGVAKAINRINADRSIIVPKLLSFAYPAGDLPDFVVDLLASIPAPEAIPNLKETLARYRWENERHETNLAKALTDAGWVPEPTDDSEVAKKYWFIKNAAKLIQYYDIEGVDYILDRATYISSYSYMTTLHEPSYASRQNELAKIVANAYQSSSTSDIVKDYIWSKRSLSIFSPPPEYQNMIRNPSPI